MDNKRLEELYTRALDGCLTPEDERDFAVHLKEHPELLQEMEAFGEIRSRLKSHVPAEVEPPYPEFFNSHLERMIREAEHASAQEAPSRSARSSWLGWLLPAGAAAVLAFFAGMQLGGPEAVGPGPVAATTPVVYSPLTSVRPEAIVDRVTGGTVIILEGLEAIPDSVDLVRTTAAVGEDPGEGEATEGVF